MATEECEASLRSENQRLKAKIELLESALAQPCAEVLELRRTVALLEEAQRMAQLGSWRYDPETMQAEWSREFRSIADLPPELPANVAAFLDCIVEEERAAFTQRCQEILNHADGGKVEGRLRKSNGEIRYIRLQGSIVSTTHGRTELRGTLLDVTEHVRLREELEQVQRTEAIGRLAAGIAHDFNNLLTIVIGNLELLGAKVGTSSELEESMIALESAGNLTRRLLAFGRRAQLTLTIVDLNDLVRSTMKLMHRLVGDHIKLEAALADVVLPVRVDSLEIERALVNLVVNARDVTPTGGVVRIQTVVRAMANGEWIDLTVADEGPGIRDSELPHIFEPFYTTKQGSGGTGLGLATVLGTAEQHGGSVRVNTEMGKGSVFTISLPAVKLERFAPKPTSPEPPGPRRGRSFRILVIDDEPMVAETCRRLLVARGHWVHVATSADEALAIWSDHSDQFDMVICDVVMPDVRGPDVVKLLSKAGALPNVLFISGYNEDPSIAAAGHSILFKPFTSVTLQKAVDQVMKSGA